MIMHTQSKSVNDHDADHPSMMRDVEVDSRDEREHEEAKDGMEKSTRNRPEASGASETPSSGHPIKHPAMALVYNVFRCNAMKQTLLVANIGSWYYTNGMNGISMQAFAGELKDSTFLSTCATTAIITCLQLLVGFFLGGGILWATQRIRNKGSAAPTPQPDLFGFLLDFAKRCIDEHSGSKSQKKDNTVLSALHAIGSLATNLGFMFGKASLVQVLKLLEPFETLVLSQVLLPTREGAGTCSSGIISSMLVVVGAAMSLLKLQSTPPNPAAVIFAILSGLSLSCRNVLQRKQHTEKPPQILPSDNDASKMSEDVSKPNMALEPQSKLERSILQFTQLSLISALWTGAVAVALYAGLWVFLAHPALVIPDVQVLIWHPLYNICSMITLGYVSALTHSLLNAGKRVVAIGMALIWFSEGLPMATVAGLLTVGVGGGWYSWESKQLKARQGGNGDSTSARRHMSAPKVVVSVAVLQLLLWFQHSQ